MSRGQPASRTNLTLASSSTKATPASAPRSKAPLKKKGARAHSSADLVNMGADLAGESGSDENTESNDVDNLRNGITNFIGDDIGQRWKIFARVWNDIIVKLRENDHISNAEKETYLFWTFDWLSKPLYLPLFQTAGCVETSIYAFKDVVSEFEAEPDVEKKMRVCVEKGFVRTTYNL